MSVLITGGAGFIGSHLAEELLDQREEVYILDNLSTGSIRNIAHLEGHPRFHCVVDSVEHEKVTEELVKECDHIYHLAAAVGVQLIVQQPTRTIETNVSATEAILRLASRYRKRVLISSTSEVYGKSEKAQFSEADDLVVGPPKKHRWSYAVSKALDEFLAMAYWREKRLPVIVVRLFNTVGPRQTDKYGMVVPRFVCQALAGKPITVYGTGEQTRCFIYVKDVVAGLRKLMACDAAIGDVFNVGNPTEISINRLALLVKEMVDTRLKIKHISYEDAYDEGFEDMLHRVPDIRKIKKAIDFTPKTKLPEILKGIIVEYRKGATFEDAKRHELAAFESHVLAVS